MALKGSLEKQAGNERSTSGGLTGTETRAVRASSFQGVVTAATSLITTLAQKNPEEFKTSVSLAVSRLSRVSLWMGNGAQGGFGCSDFMQLIYSFTF